MADPDALPALPFTGNAEADELLAREPLALLIGFVLDQQVTVQKAFSGPYELNSRIGTLNARAIAALPLDDLEAVFRARPALHRFPASMARRTQELCAAVARDYAGDAGRIWSEAIDAADLKRRLLALPGIGAMKSDTIFAILVKRYGLRPDGWQAALPVHPTLGDVDSAAALDDYQAGKRARKAASRRATRDAQAD